MFLGKCFCCFFICYHGRSCAVACCHLSFLGVPHTLELGSSPLLSWDQALSFLLTRCLLLNLFPLSCCCGCGFFVEGPPAFRDQALSCLAATQVLLAFVCLIACLLVCLLCWSSPGCFQDHGSATMKRFTALLL